MTRQSVIAYWLIPSEPERSFFQRIINDLARRYDAPVFEPHVTVHVGADLRNAPENALGNAARGCKLIELTTLAIGHSNDFVKTLFVQFALSTELKQMNKCIRDAANDSSQYELNPHLSLLYKSLPTPTRRQLAASMNVAFPDVRFDTIRALRCVSPTQTGADVESWELVASTLLR